MDSRGLKMNAVEFGCYLAKLSRSRLTAVFLEDVLADRLQADLRCQVPVDGQGCLVSDTGPVAESVEDRIRAFRDACSCREVATRVHRDRGIPEAEILDESRFADLIIVDVETSFRDRPAAVPSPFVNHIVSSVECPVVISPTSFERIDEIVFAYNATASSVKAIKQFTYLFPEYSDKKVMVVNVREGEEGAIEESFKLKEWLGEHYREAEFHVLKGNPMDQLFGYLLHRRHAFVVMGAYGRGILSRFFRPSHARLIIRSLNLPIFIAHQ